MTDSGWEPLPADVAEWMGMDETMVSFAVDLTSPTVTPPSVA